jgi:hypothetical protein
MAARDEVARKLAERDYFIHEGMVEIYRLLGQSEGQNDPIKLLEVDSLTEPSGVMPLGFRPMPEQGIPFPSIVVVVTPQEFTRIKSGELPLPHGWRLGEFIPQGIFLPDELLPEEFLS